MVAPWAWPSWWVLITCCQPQLKPDGWVGCSDDVRTCSFQVGKELWPLGHVCVYVCYTCYISLNVFAYIVPACTYAMRWKTLILTAGFRNALGEGVNPAYKSNGSLGEGKTYLNCWTLEMTGIWGWGSREKGSGRREWKGAGPWTWQEVKVWEEGGQWETVAWVIQGHVRTRYVIPSLKWCALYAVNSLWHCKPSVKSSGHTHALYRWLFLGGNEDQGRKF